MRISIAAAFLMAMLGTLAPLGQTRAEPDRPLIVGIKEAPPFVIKAADGAWTGMSIDLWRRIAEQLHLTYTLKETTLQGLIDGTADGSLDAAIAAISVTEAREKVVDFTQPFFMTGLGIAIPRVAKFDWWQLLASFLTVGFLQALVALVGITIAVGGLVWLIERRHSHRFGGSKEHLSATVLWSARTMIQAVGGHEPATLAGRLIAAIWMGAGVLVIAVFTAGITSQLTARQLQGLVHGLEDLRFARVGAIDGTSSIDYLAHRRIATRLYASPRDALTALEAGKLDAVVYDRPLLAWLIHEGFRNTVDLLDATFDKDTYAIALPPSSPLRQPLNLAILPLIQSQWWADLNVKYLGKE